MAKKSFIKGAAILGIAGILVKVLGAFFRIPLANLIGDVGMAYYQAVYPVYNIFLAVQQQVYRCDFQDGIGEKRDRQV